MPLVSIEDVELELGRDLTEDEEDRAEYFISKITTYIEGLTGMQFSVAEDDVVRVQADYYGVIELGGGPILDVTSVTSWRSSTELGYWHWDGMDLVYNLQPLQTVDVTYSHGSETAPADLTLVAAEAVAELIRAEATNGVTTVGGLKQRTVGDVTYAFYEDSGTLGINLPENVLGRYVEDATTYRVGGPTPPWDFEATSLPTL